MKGESRTPKQKVYFDTGVRDNECDMRNDYIECMGCLDSASYSLYEDMKKVYPKANKVLVVAYSPNYKGQTEYKVIDLTEDILKELLNLSKYMRVYREGRRFYALAASNDTSEDSIWRLVLKSYNGELDNEELAKQWMKDYQ